ncbi:DUF6153 family protein [Kitasatospora sp. NPDC048722]|uniref:DUF6153 family protein n=1 Tax=Kitasatospora sp. NPDC048722 TaxID=3155639 RepID=UPI0033CF99DE
MSGTEVGGVRGGGVVRVLRGVLLAALLLGVLTMHTLGHPVGGHGGGHGGEHVAVRVHQVHDVTADAGMPGGMDPMTVCLAVPASWGLVLLAVGGYVLRRDGDAAAAVPALSPAAVRGLPPPRGGRSVLADVSVLRQ